MQRNESVMMLPKWVVQGISHYKDIQESLSCLRDFFSSTDRFTTASASLEASQHSQGAEENITRKRTNLLICEEEPRPLISLKRSKSNTSASASQYSSSPFSSLQPPSQIKNEIKIEDEGDERATLSPYFANTRSLQRSSYISPSPSAPLPPSQTTQPMATRASIVSERILEVDSSSSADQEAPVLCCNACSSPLAYQQAAQVEMITKRYFWYACYTLRQVWFVLAQVLFECSKLVSHSVRETTQTQPWEVPVHSLSANSLIKSNCRALTEAEMIELKPNIPSTSPAKNNKASSPSGGRAVSTIWASTDGLLYVPLFCYRYMPPLHIHAAEIDDHLQDLDATHHQM